MQVRLAAELVLESVQREADAYARLMARRVRVRERETER